MNVPHPLAILNLLCFEVAVGICEALLAETVIGIFACVAGARIACDSDTVGN